MTFRLVYDITTAGPSIFAIVFFAGSLVFLAVTVALIRKPELMRVGTEGRTQPASPPSRPWKLLPFALIFAFGALAFLDGGRRDLARLAVRDGCTEVEGVVSDYHYASGRNPMESFNVNGVRFEYREGDPAFSDTAWLRGPIKPDLPVRICYHASETRDQNLIFRLEVGT